MPDSPNGPAGPPIVPNHYRRLTGSQRGLGRRSTWLGAADPDTRLTLTLCLRRRIDGPPTPDLDFWRLTHPAERRYLTPEERAMLYGASPTDLKAVAEFAEAAGLTVHEAHAGRRRVIVSGAVATIEAAFAVSLGRFESPAPRAGRTSLIGDRANESGRQVHHSWTGHIHLPETLSQVVIAVFGLDDRKVGVPNLSLTNADPLPVNPVTVPLVCELYNWPTGPIPSQTVGLIGGGLNTEDITYYYENLNASLYNQVSFPEGFYVQALETTYQAQSPPGDAVTGQLVAPTQAAGTLVFASGQNSGVSDGETNLDVSLSSSIAQQATIAIYFYDGTAASYLDAFSSAISPNAGEPIITVLSCSYSIAVDGDDQGGIEFDGDGGGEGYGGNGITPMEVWAISQVIADAAPAGITVCVASGDNGVGDTIVQEEIGRHLSYPASDPGVLCVGGTTIGAINGRTFDENLWSDQYGVTGGGVSAFFNSGNKAYPQARQPSWQAKASVPKSLNDGSVGRGSPDVAANAGPSGYHLYTNGGFAGESGTSAASPLVAGMIAQLNAALGYQVGFINATLYNTDGRLCRKISSNAAINAVGNSYLTPGSAASGQPLEIGIQGYPGEATGWDACTGWGVPDYSSLVTALTRPKKSHYEKSNPEKGYLEKAHLDGPWPPFVGGGGKLREGGGLTGLGDPYYPATDERLTRVESALSDLTNEVRALRAFIRPDERPPVGEAAKDQDGEG